MVYQFEAFQFLSRSNVRAAKPRRLKTSPRERDDLKFVLTLDIEAKPFELEFAQLKPVRPSIGAYEFIDPDVDGLAVHHRRSEAPLLQCIDGILV